MPCWLFLLIFFCWTTSTTSTANIFTGHTIVGVFDSEELSVIFKDLVISETSIDARVVTYLANSTSPLELQTELCSLDNILYIYVVSSNPVIQYTTSLASAIDVPIFVFDTSNRTTQLAATTNTQFYMNNHISDEGNAFAKIAHAAKWPHVVIAVWKEWSHDGLVQSFNALFVDELGLYSVTVEQDDLQTASTLLINIETVLTSKLLERHAHSTHNIIVLHMPPDIAAQVLEGADLLFHDRRIIWLVSSMSLPESIPDVNPIMVKLVSPPVDRSYIAGSVHRIVSQMKSLQLVNNSLPIVSTGCNGSMVTLSPPWLPQFVQVGLVADHRLTYYQYRIHATSNEGIWYDIDGISSAPNYSYSALAKSLAQKERQTYTLVSVVDKPFNFKNFPQMFDGEAYCQTPAVICLGISEAVIKTHGHSSEIVKTIFTDYYRGIVENNRTYTVHCCEGLAMDLLQTLSSELEFDYQLYLSPDGTFGAIDNDTGNWTGVVKELLDGRADMITGSFSIISSRSEVIDYTAPYYYSGFSMMASTRENLQTNYFSITKPFEVAVWAMFMTMAVVAFIALSTFEWKSPFGMNPTHNRERESYSLASGIKTIFSLMSGNTLPCKHPQSTSGKFTQNVWGAFGIIYLAGYTANLTSSITDNTFVLEVDGIYDTKLLDLKVAANAKSSSETFVKTINPSLYDNMVTLQVNSTDDGVAKLRDGDLNVFIHDTSVIDYLTSQENYDCKLFKLGTFSVDSYGSAFPQNEHQSLKNAISNKYLEYQSSGYIDKLRKIYFPPSRACISITDNEEIQLTVVNAAGLFILLSGFIVICFCMIGVEHVIFHYVIPHAKKKPEGSWWKGLGLMFLSQRVHRAIMIDGAHNGAAVFRNFANKIAKSTNVFALSKKQPTKPAAVRLTFYDVVAKAYEVKYCRPFDCLYMRGWRHKPKMNSPAGSALTEMVMMAAGMAGAAEAKKRYSEMLDEGVKQFRAQTEANGQCSGVPTGDNLDPNSFNTTNEATSSNAEDTDNTRQRSSARLHIQNHSPLMRRLRYHPGFSSSTFQLIEETEGAADEEAGLTNETFIGDRRSCDVAADNDVDELDSSSNMSVVWHSSRTSGTGGDSAPDDC